MNLSRYQSYRRVALVGAFGITVLAALRAAQDLSWWRFAVLAALLVAVASLVVDAWRDRRERIEREKRSAMRRSALVEAMRAQNEWINARRNRGPDG